MPWHLRVVNEGQETAKIAKSHAREWAGARIRRHKIPSMNICPVRDSCRSTYATSESQELTKRKEPRSCPILCLFIPYLCYIFTFISSYRRMSMVRDCASSRQDTLRRDTARRSDEQHDERWDIPFGRDTVPRVHNNIWIPEHGLCEMRERLLIYWLSVIGIDIQDVLHWSQGADGDIEWYCKWVYCREVKTVWVMMLCVPNKNWSLTQLWKYYESLWSQQEGSASARKQQTYIYKLKKKSTAKLRARVNPELWFRELKMKN